MLKFSNSKDRILVTGAGGFIGPHLLRALLERGYQAKDMTVFLWDDEVLPADLHGKLSEVRGDIRSFEDVFLAMKNVKTIFHLAARTDFDGHTLSDYYDVNVVGTQNVLEAGHLAGARRIVFFSSMAVHGIPAEVGRIEGWSESDAPQRHGSFHPYGHSKWIAEQRIRAAYRDYGLEYAIIRPTSVYGPGEKGPTKALIQAIDQGLYFQIGSGKNFMDYVYVGDLVEGATQAAESPEPYGTVLMSGPSPVPFRKVVTAIYEALGKTPPRFFVPGWLILLAVWPLGVMRAIWGVRFPLYPQRVRTLLSTYWFDTTRARRHYKYAPQTALSAGIQKTVAWYQQENA